MKSKKGAETTNAGNVAVLVALIALFIIIYVLLRHYCDIVALCGEVFEPELS